MREIESAVKGCTFLGVRLHKSFGAHHIQGPGCKAPKRSNPAVDQRAIVRGCRLLRTISWAWARPACERRRRKAFCSLPLPRSRQVWPL